MSICETFLSSACFQAWDLPPACSSCSRRCSSRNSRRYPSRVSWIQAYRLGMGTGPRRWRKTCRLRVPPSAIFRKGHRWTVFSRTCPKSSLLRTRGMNPPYSIRAFGFSTPPALVFLLSMQNMLIDSFWTHFPLVSSFVAQLIVLNQDQKMFEGQYQRDTCEVLSSTLRDDDLWGVTLRSSANDTLYRLLDHDIALGPVPCYVAPSSTPTIRLEVHSPRMIPVLLFLSLLALYFVHYAVNLVRMEKYVREQRRRQHQGCVYNSVRNDEFGVLRSE